VPYERFSVRSSHGYRIVVTTTYEAPFGVYLPFSFPVTTLTVLRRHEGASYEVYGQAPHLRARFGNLGRVRATPHPRGRVFRSRTSPSHAFCEPVGRPRERPATFTGMFEFRGEGGFTAVRRRHMSGGVGMATFRCPERAGPGFQVGRGPLVVAAASGVAFQAGSRAFDWVFDRELLRRLGLGKLRGDGVPFVAEMSESRHGMSVSRIAAAKGGSGSLGVKGGGQIATLEPPPPFSGTAVLRNCPRTVWHGTLTVRFPGRTVHLVRKRTRRAAYLASAPKCPRK
jgi:hypothetical protein